MQDRIAKLERSNRRMKTFLLALSLLLLLLLLTVLALVGQRLAAPNPRPRASGPQGGRPPGYAAGSSAQDRGASREIKQGAVAATGLRARNSHGAGREESQAAGGENSRWHTIAARNFLLLDASGSIRARLHTKDGDPVLRLQGEDSEVRVAVGISDGRPVLALSDGRQNRRAILSILDSEVSLRLYGPDETTPRAAIGLTAAGANPWLQLYDKQGTPRAELTLDDTGPRLALAHESGKPGPSVSAGKNASAFSLADGNGLRGLFFANDGGSKLVLYGRHGQEGAVLSENAAGAGLLINRQDGTTRALLGQPGLGLFDETGQIVWSTP